MDNLDRSLSRRTLLRATVGGVAFAAVGSLLAACAPAAPANQPAASTAAQQAPAASNVSGGQLKVGLLSGFSGTYAAFGSDMASSIEVYLDQHGSTLGGIKPTIIQEAEGATPQDALLKARKLVEQDRVNVLVGIVSSAN